jgi:arylsulfatase A-like enzyme
VDAIREVTMAEDDAGAKPESANGLDRRSVLLSGASLFALAAVGSNAAQAADQPKPQAAPSGSQPNILFIMGDDIGWFNIGAYNRGMMAGKTPNLDKLASEGMLFQSYYAEASCTAGRANFITGELPIRTGLTTVGQAGATVGMPDKAPTIATALKTMGYATGQFGKNHLGDRNEYLPTVHGFDEFFGYLYHLDAMEDPFHRNYPQDLRDKVGPRNILHCLASDEDDQTVDPRWGKVGKQKITDEGPLPPDPIDGIKYNMTTFDEVIRDKTIAFIDKAKGDGKPFFVWYNPTRMHVITHLSQKYEDMRNAQNGWSIEEAGMAQMDDCVGAVLQHLEDQGLADNTIVVFTPTTAPRISRGPMAARPRSPAPRARHSKAASASRASCAGAARFRPVRSTTASCPGSTGSRLWSPLPAIRTSSRSCSPARISEG